ncbi:MAG: MFS transporter [Zavarzinella sp.]
MNTEKLANRGKWTALTAALLGWMFDGLEMGLFPLVARPALKDLLQTENDSLVGLWFTVITAMFLVGAATGGVLFGWLGDRIGRVKAMTLSVFIYAVFSGLCGLATSATQIAILRFIASLGMGGEWSLGVALVMEIWPDRSRAWLAGVIGAAANVGYMLIALLGMVLTTVTKDLQGLLASTGMGDGTIQWLFKNDGWRVLMLLGATPAILTFLIRLFVPESKSWEKENAKGTTSMWKGSELLGLLGGSLLACGFVALWAANDISLIVRIVGSVLLLPLIAYGFAYPILGFLKRMPETTGSLSNREIKRRLTLAALLSGVALLGTWGSIQMIPTWADSLPNRTAYSKAYVQIASAFGAVVGCIVAALCGGWFGRRKTYAVLCFLSIGAVLYVFRMHDKNGAALVLASFVAGLITASFYGWLPLYLPELFPTRMRAIGQGFGFNFGRIIAAVGVLQLGNMMRTYNLSYPTACSFLSLIYIVGFVVIWLAPETKGKPLPE